MILNLLPIQHSSGDLYIETIILKTTLKSGFSRPEKENVLITDIASVSS